MGVTISIGAQKGGVGKSTTACITSFLLAVKGYRVLTIDFDSSGNTTQILSRRDIYDFEDKTILNAIIDMNPEEFIINVGPNHDLLPADDILSPFSRQMAELRKSYATVLKDMIEIIKDKYDFILIDTPPTLGELTVGALSSSDYVVVMLQSEPLCFKALPRYLQLLDLIKAQISPSVNIAGILGAMIDQRTKIDSSIIELARNQYEDWVFETVIKRRNRIKEFSLEGISTTTKEDRDALEQYNSFVEELIGRVLKKG